MAKVELIYDSDCPNVDAARELLRRAFREINRIGEWQEWDRGVAGSPAHVQQFGSPTILVDGKDVAGPVQPGEGNCCRINPSEERGLQGAPPFDAIVMALRNGVNRGEWLASLAVVPAIGLALLPNLACPACWLAYAGLLSSIGLRFLTRTVYLLSFNVAFIVVAVGALGFRARNRQGFGPCVIGLVAAAVVMVGRFLFESSLAMHSGITLLIGASIWNSWPKQTKPLSRPSCAGSE